MKPYRFGNRLRQLRLDSGLSLRDLARGMGIPHPQIARWEKMPLAPKQATLDRLAMALGCAVTDLLPGGNKSGTSPEYRVLTEKLTAQQEEICGLKEEIEEIGAERNQLRAIITDFFDASQPGVDDWRKSAAKTKFLSQATEIKHQEMMKAVGGIGDPII